MATVAFVTGAGRGIGRAIALRLATAGIAVGVTDVDAASADAVAGEIRRAGGRALGAAGDVTSLDAMRGAVRAVEQGLGAIDALVNNAGWDKMELFLDNDPALWDRLIAINYKGVLNTTRAVLEGMAARGSGRVVSIASDAGRVGSTGEAVYSGCKAGIIGFSKALAREVAAKGITVNVVCPGPTDTALLAEVGATPRGAKIVAAMHRAIPLGRIGQPEDVVGAVAFLVSDEAAFVTGQVLSVSGGLSMVG
ncbi:MAG TPA: SDR family oxidoreductase [Candidatus Eisenbacteria bacterium]|nr:SDR family oxidoreductase [Candidatus Eisenbacteria bacterium]